MIRCAGDFYLAFARVCRIVVGVDHAVVLVRGARALFCGLFRRVLDVLYDVGARLVELAALFHGGLVAARPHRSARVLFELRGGASAFPARVDLRFDDFLDGNFRVGAPELVEIFLEFLDRFLPVLADLVPQFFHVLSYSHSRYLGFSIGRFWENMRGN